MCAHYFAGSINIEIFKSESCAGSIYSSKGAFDR